MKNSEKVDLSDKVTVFLITVGASSFEDCEKALQTQDSTFQLQYVRNIAPMNAAFQQMLNRCKTPYYIQVDEDMILKPHAVKTMYEVFLAKKDSQLAFTCFPLWDKHVRRTIIGVKIYDHSIMRNYPYRNVQSCEMDQVERMKKAGYRYDIEWGGPWHTHQGKLTPQNQNIMGFHGTKYTDREAFERYRDLVEKYRWVGGNDWVSIWPQNFVDRSIALKDLDSSDFWAFLGSVVGLTTVKGSGEKDYRSYSGMKDFGELRAHLVNPPTRLDVYTTEQCNFSCSFCTRQKHKQVTNAPDFSPHLATRVLDMYPSIVSACVAGFGEPLTSPNLVPLLTTLLNRRIATSLITNGFLIDRRLNDVPWNRLLYVNVSLNEVGPQLHAKVTGVQHAFDAIVNNIQMLQKKGVNVGLSFVVDAKSFNRIPSFIDFAAKHRAAFVSIVNTLPHHNVSLPAQNQAFWDRVITDQTPNFPSFLKNAKQYARSKGVNVNAWPTPISKAHNPRHCRSPFTAIGFDGNGFYSGCCRVMGPARQFGHINEGPNLWNESPRLIKLRRELGGSMDLRPECSMCFGNWQRT